jgi:hypothetical protein
VEGRLPPRWTHSLHFFGPGDLAGVFEGGGFFGSLHCFPSQTLPAPHPVSFFGGLGTGAGFFGSLHCFPSQTLPAPQPVSFGGLGAGFLALPARHRFLTVPLQYPYWAPVFPLHSCLLVCHNLPSCFPKSTTLSEKKTHQAIRVPSASYTRSGLSDVWVSRGLGKGR